MPSRIEYNITTGEHREIEMTPEEIAAMQQAIDPKVIAANEILRLESESKIPRVSREFMLSVMEKEAIDAGYTLEQLYAANIGYRKLKDLDTQIRTLRKQL